jgi:hypothetical protein
MRIHTVPRIAGEVQVEDLGADGYPSSQASPPVENVATANLVLPPGAIAELDTIGQEAMVPRSR